MKSKWRTLQFIIKKVQQFFPSFLPLLFLQALFKIILIVIDVYFISFMIIIIQTNSMEEAMLQVFLLLFAILIIKLVLSVLDKVIGIKNEVLNEYIMKEIDDVLVHSTFEKLEQSSFLEQVCKVISPVIDYDAIFELLTSTPAFFQYGLTIVTLLIVFISKDLMLLGIILIMFLIHAFFQYYSMKKETSFLQERMKLNKQYWYYLRTVKNPSIAKEVRVYSLQSFLLQKIDSLLQKLSSHNVKITSLKSKRDIINVIMNLSVMIITYILILLFGYQKAFNSSDLMLLVSAATALFAAFQGFQSTLLTCNKQLVLLSDYVMFSSISKVEKKDGQIELTEPISSIEFENVCFSYPNAKEMVIDHLDLILKDNMWISIVGSNGSGKTTLMKLLTRLYQPSKGRILVNGIDIKLYEYSSYIKQFSIVFQDFCIFQYSIEENIAFQKKNKQRLQEVIEQSDFNKVIEELPEGMYTSAGRSFDEHGVYLSKGQEQKLAIARSLYKNGSVLILDEPTASLDPLAEEEIFQQFHRITKDKLSITISHRLSSCQLSDSIIVLHQGKVYEVGTHEELMKKKGLYAEMFTLQKSKYE